MFPAAATRATVVASGFFLCAVSKAITADPEPTVGAGFSSRVINPFLMWAAEDTIGEGCVRNIVVLEECDDLGINLFVLANVAGLHEPLAHGGRFFLFAWKNGHNKFGG